jgi:ABC-2 type transport system permease protein
MTGRIAAMLLRYLYLYRRSAARVMGVVFWPVMDLLVWGFLTSYLEKAAVPQPVLFLLAQVIFWDVFYSSAQAITLSITEDIWGRNILNVFVSPIRVSELMIATSALGCLRALASAALLSLLAALFYGFRIASLGLALAPFLASLLLFGWAVGMMTTALILRYGQAAEALIWGVPFLIQPLSAAFYPVAVLPAWLRPVALAIPATPSSRGCARCWGRRVPGGEAGGRVRAERRVSRRGIRVLRVDAGPSTREGVPGETGPGIAGDNPPVTPHPFGLHRSLDPPGALPQTARRLDATPRALENELADRRCARFVDRLRVLPPASRDRGGDGESVRRPDRPHRARARQDAEPGDRLGRHARRTRARGRPRHPAAGRSRPAIASPRSSR